MANLVAVIQKMQIYFSKKICRQWSYRSLESRQLPCQDISSRYWPVGRDSGPVGSWVAADLWASGWPTCSVDRVTVN